MILLVHNTVNLMPTIDIEKNNSSTSYWKAWDLCRSIREESEIYTIVLMKVIKSPERRLIYSLNAQDVFI